MTLEEASRQFKIDIDDLKVMVKEGLISDPIMESEINNLSFLSYFWEKSYWLKRQLSRMNKKARMSLVHTAGLSRIESYIFNRYYNASERLFVKQVAEEIRSNYGTPITKGLINTIYRIRRKARNARYQDQKKPEITI